MAPLQGRFFFGDPPKSHQPPLPRKKWTVPKVWIRLISAKDKIIKEAIKTTLVVSKMYTYIMWQFLRQMYFIWEIIQGIWTEEYQ